MKRTGTKESRRWWDGERTPSDKIRLECGESTVNDANQIPARHPEWPVKTLWGQPILRLCLVFASVMVAGVCSAGDVSRCPVDTVPIQIVNETRSGPETTLTVARISDAQPRFPDFVTAVTKHVAARLDRENLCLDRADSKKRSLIQFTNLQLTSGFSPLHPVARVEMQPTHGCRVFSPWIDVAIERKPVPWIRGIVRWNQRQFLADQAVLAGVRNVPAGLATPMPSTKYMKYAQDYARSEIRPRQPAATPIEDRLPPDILWLFRQAKQSTFVLFGGASIIALDREMNARSDRHAELVIALIDRCLASSGGDIHYSSILDIADLISLEQYKTDTPIR